MKEKKCTGESGDIGDIAKNVNIAMQKIIDRLLNETDRHIMPENGHTKPAFMRGE